MYLNQIQFFSENIVFIFFLYGLSFFLMGFACFLKIRPSNINLVKALPWLAAFGIFHGINEWLEMFEAIYPQLETSLIFNILIFVFFTGSVFLLFTFGTMLLYHQNNDKRILSLFWILAIWLGFIVFLPRGVDILRWLGFVKNFSRLLIYFPGSVISGIALIDEYQFLIKQKKTKIAYYFLYAGIAFFVNAIFGGLIGRPAPFFPYNIFNTITFLHLVKVPVQLFRAMSAVLIAVFIIRALDIFYFEEQQQKNIALILQKSLRPTKIPKIKNYQLGIYYRSATVEATIGGDFYDFINIPDGLIFFVGDVSGKGINAAAETGNIKNLLRYFVLAGYETSQAVAELNNALSKEYKTRLFTSTVIVKYNFQEKAFHFINSGHPKPLIYDRNQRNLYYIESSSTVLGVIKDEKYPSTKVSANNTDLIVLYTDGLLEARRNKVLFGENNIKKAVSEFKNLPAQDIADNLVQSAINYTGDILYDDILVLVLKKQEHRRLGAQDHRSLGT